MGKIQEDLEKAMEQDFSNPYHTLELEKGYDRETIKDAFYNPYESNPQLTSYLKDSNVSLTEEEMGR